MVLPIGYHGRACCEADLLKRILRSRSLKDFRTFVDCFGGLAGGGSGGSMLPEQHQTAEIREGGEQMYFGLPLIDPGG